MNKISRNQLRSIIVQCRTLLERSVSDVLQGDFGIHSTGLIEDAARMKHLSVEDRQYREQILIHLEHIQSFDPKQKGIVIQLAREVSFTHLNRLCAYKMMEKRGLIEEAVSRGLKSRGFLFYLADHPDDEKLWSGGQQELAYKHFLDWLSATLSEEIGVLFSPQDLANRLFPPFRVLDQVLSLINTLELEDIWVEDEAIGWVYQYFTPKELRDKARKESVAPRNSYELAFRNQFFTPRYVVEFLTDNTLGRTWYEMRKGATALTDRCRYFVRRPNEIFLQPGETAPAETEKAESLSKEDIFRQPVYIPHRQKKDPREIRILDPACGSGHFLLYCFDLLQVIYKEAYADEDLGPRLRADFPDVEDFSRSIPALILEHNLHGIDIDLRATQIAQLALWLRAQRAWQEMGVKRKDRQRIQQSHIVCAEPMPGEAELLDEFVSELQPRLLGQLVRVVFEKMKLAGEAGSLLRIEDEISKPITKAKKEWENLSEPEQLTLFDKAKHKQHSLFDVRSVTDAQFWDDAEERVMKVLREYANRATDGKGMLRRLFADDALQGFAFVDLCRKKFDAVLMNPPFGDASIPSKPYIDETYGDTKGDVYKAFVECFQDRLVPSGLLGIISSRTGFFLGQSADWRERIVLRLYRPLLLADFGVGVLDAMVETAAYVLRSLTVEEDRQLTLQLVPELERVPTDKKGIFSTKKYEETRGLKRHQANGELRRLQEIGFITSVESRFPRWSLRRGVMARVQVPPSASYPSLACLRLLGEQDKGGTLLAVSGNSRDSRYFVAYPESFRFIPNGPFVYWAPRSVLNLFTGLELYSAHGEVKQGLATKDNDRFVRLWWEVSPSELGKARWRTYAKGGDYARYYLPLLLVVDWSDEAQSIYKSRTGQMVVLLTGKRDRYINRRGLTYSKRSQIGFSVRAMPMQSIFSPNGPGVFPKGDEYLYHDLAVLNSEFSRACIDFLTSFGSYSEGYVESLPYPNSIGEGVESLSNLSKRCIDICRKPFTHSELIREFILPFVHISKNISSLAEERAVLSDLSAKMLNLAEEDINSQIASNLGLSEQDRAFIKSSAEKSFYSKQEMEEDDEIEDSTPLLTDHLSFATDLISYFVGCAFGRWDVRLATGERLAPELPDPFAPLPFCAPGALQSEEGLPLTEPPPGYPMRIDWDGILVDDSDHEDDIIRRVRDVFELIWKDRAEAIEREAYELLGVGALRDYFRKPGAGGFWADHIKRYSKSRRKAPIYWLLQSSKKNYGLWLYYHRLDKDMLFKALLNYVEPKLRLEENQLTQLRQQRASVGAAGREAKQIEKQLDRQEALLSELYDFRDKLKRAAELGLEPDLNDGVVLNIAPLWELTPWSEAKKYWLELLAGKYEWSSIGKQLRERGIVKE